jgi:putative PIN family toxin of toxin-antitoxin system
MKVLLDTNVIIAAFITRGACSELLDHCIQHHVLITSEFILNEFREHMIHKFGYDVEEVEEAVDLLKLKMRIVKPSSFNNPICRDPDDDIVLGTAVAGGVACIVTGDKDLLILRQFSSFDILTPAKFPAYESTTN